MAVGPKNGSALPMVLGNSGVRLYNSIPESLNANADASSMCVNEEDVSAATQIQTQQSKEKQNRRTIQLLRKYLELYMRIALDLQRVVNGLNPH